jgi:cell division protein FtsW
MSFLFAVHRLHYKYFSAGVLILLPVAFLLLAFTLFKGTEIGGANASRWIVVPYIGVSIQTSALAALVLMVYLARYLSRVDFKTITIKSALLPVFLPIAVVCGLILPANFSTAFIIFAMSMVMLFIGGFPMKYLVGLVGAGVLGLALFILVVKAIPNISNRLDTWEKRIEAFTNGEAAENYQVNKAKSAIAFGKLTGSGPGKSIQKHFLPQSNSDFIFAIIVEEYGLFGGVVIIGLYFFFFIRLLMVISKADSAFGKLAALGAGMGIMFQALINMGVAVNLFPVTGQTLPLISAGGSSIWITCISLGVIQSVARVSAQQGDPVDDFAEVSNDDELPADEDFPNPSITDHAHA